MELQIRLGWSQTALWETWRRIHSGTDAEILAWGVTVALVYEAGLALSSLNAASDAPKGEQGAQLRERLSLIKQALGDNGIEVRWSPAAGRSQWRTAVMSWENI